MNNLGTNNGLFHQIKPMNYSYGSCWKPFSQHGVLVPFCGKAEVEPGLPLGSTWQDLRVRHRHSLRAPLDAIVCSLNPQIKETDCNVEVIPNPMSSSGCRD